MVVAKLFCGEKNLFEKRFFSPHPIFQKLSPELLLLQVIKVIPTYFI